nr:hypothetical protein [Nostoc sp. FACHB-110]
MRLKRWESPRREGRNDKGKGGSARRRQLKKQRQMLRQRLKENNTKDNQNNNNQPKREEQNSSLFLFGNTKSVSEIFTLCLLCSQEK